MKNVACKNSKFTTTVWVWQKVLPTFGEAELPSFGGRYCVRQKKNITAG
jgi:hypothetical protein